MTDPRDIKAVIFNFPRIKFFSLDLVYTGFDKTLIWLDFLFTCDFCILKHTSLYHVLLKHF